jgi:hypothetical protein
MVAVKTEMPDVGRKKINRKDGSRQVNLKMPADLIERLQETAHLLGMEFSGLVRYILLKGLPEFEEQARRIHGKREGGEE